MTIITDVNKVLKKNNGVYVLGSVLAGFVGLWLYDVISSNMAGHRVLHHAAGQQVCTSCVASSTTPGSFDCSNCATVGTVGAPAFGCLACNPSTTTPGSFTCTGCEGFMCGTCTAGATPDSFTCTGCVDALTATITPPAPADDPCSRVTTPCIYDTNVKGCVRQGNSACTCSGCKKPSTSTSTSKPSTPQPKTLAGGSTPGQSAGVAAGLQAAQRLAKLDPHPAPAKPVKICPPLVKC